jgi:hypothetical protein
MSGSMHYLLHSFPFFHMLCTFVWNCYFYHHIFVVILRKSSACIYEDDKKKYISRLLFCLGKFKPIHDDRFVLILYARIRFHLFP